MVIGVSESNPQNQYLIHDRHEGPFSDVAIVEIAPCLQWNSQRAERTGCDHGIDRDGGRIVPMRRQIIDKIIARRTDVSGQRHGRARRQHPGDGPNLCKYVFEEQVGIADRTWAGGLHHQNVLWTKTHRHIVQCDEALDQQTGYRKQDHGQRDLGYHQGSSRAHHSTSHRSGRLFQCMVQFDLRCIHGRCCTEQNARQN
jgi:hypothetical protein